MDEALTNFYLSELKRYSDEATDAKVELEKLKYRIEDILTNPCTTDLNGNRLTGAQIKDQQLKRIMDLVMPEKSKIVPMMGLFNDTQDDLDNLKIGFKS